MTMDCCMTNVHSATFEHSSAQPGQACAYECGSSEGWASSDSGGDSHGSGMLPGIDGIDDMLDLDMMSDEELLEGLFGRVERETDHVSLQSCTVEDNFARLRLKQ